MQISIEDPRQADIVAALAEADAWYATLYPAESNHLLDVETLRDSAVTFFAARSAAGVLLGYGAVVDRGEYAEIKRMYVAPAARALQLGRRLLDALERHAARLGRNCLRLETGIHQPAAIGLYRKAGYTDREPFGGHAADPLSLFMEKRLP